MDSQTLNVDVAMAPDEESTETSCSRSAEVKSSCLVELTLREDVQYAVEDGLGVTGNDIATLRETPRNRVQEPEADSPDTDNGVGSQDICSNRTGIGATLEDDGVCDEEEGNRAEGEEP